MAREIRKPVAGITSEKAQKLFSTPTGVAASRATPTVITIKEKTKDYYVIDFTGEGEVTRVLHSPKYTILTDMIAECEDFQKTLMEDDLYSLV